MVMVPFGQWLPDQSDYQNAGATVAKNVIPRTASSYGPLGTLTAVSAVVPNRPQGAGAFRDNDGVVYNFCGDVNDLYQYSASGASWSEVSSSTGAYTVAAEDTVEFVKYGETVISCNGHTDAIQNFVMGTDSTFSTLAAAAPRAKHLAVIGNFVMAGNTWDSTDTAVGNRIWWCAIDNPTSWPTIASAAAAAVQSDRLDIPIGGHVQALTGAIGGLDGAVFCERAIHRLQYQGPPAPFGRYVVDQSRGTPAPNSVVNIGTNAFFLAEDGFYSFTGSGSIPIGAERVNKWFYNQLNDAHYHRIYGAADPINHLVFWLFPGSGSSGTPNRIIVYNWAVDRWSYAEVTAEMLFSDLTSGYTMEELDAITTSMETLPFSLDSRIWMLGKLALSAFDTDDKLARFTGTAMAATVETAETGGPGLTLVNGVRPYVDGGTVTVGLKHRLLPTGAETLVGPNAIDGNGQANFTVNDRYHRAQVVVAAGGTWTHAQGVEYDAAPEGIV